MVLSILKRWVVVLNWHHAGDLHFGTMIERMVVRSVRRDENVLVRVRKALECHSRLTRCFLILTKAPRCQWMISSTREESDNRSTKGHRLGDGSGSGMRSINIPTHSGPAECGYRQLGWEVSDSVVNIASDWTGRCGVATRAAKARRRPSAQSCQQPAAQTSHVTPTVHSTIRTMHTRQGNKQGD